MISSEPALSPTQTLAEPLIIHSPSPGKTFKFSGKKFHLTYKSHLDPPIFISWLKSVVGNLKWYSLVHELGKDGIPRTEQGMPSLPYAHTHVAFEAEKKIQSRDQRLLDWLGIHPNIKPIRDQAHAEQIWTYHQKDPILLYRSETSPVRDTNYLDRIQFASTLKEAMEIAGVTIKTVSDIVALRRESQPQILPQLDTHYSWTFMAPPAFTSLFVSGPSGTGKTRWAIAQFQSCLLVSHMDTLKQFMPGRHDGIVFDDMNFLRLTPQEAIHLLDWEMPRTINVKFGSVTIPANTQKIFTNNRTFHDSMPVCSPEEYNALARRVNIITVTHQLFQLTGNSGDTPAESAPIMDTNPFSQPDMLEFLDCMDDL